jgi:hypothetical protein
MTDINDGLRKLAQSKSGTEQDARSVLNEVFRDEAVAMRATILSVSRSKLSLIKKLMTVADAMADTFSDGELLQLKEEFKDEPLTERIRMFQTLVNSIGALSASSSYVLDLESALVEFEKNLIPAEASSMERAMFKNVLEKIRTIVSAQVQDVEFREVNAAKS